MSDKIKLNKVQKEILERLNTMLFHDYWPVIQESLEKSLSEPTKLKEYDEMTDDQRLAYLQGYGKAVWDITYSTSAATDGFLPNDKTIKKWVDEADKKMREEFDVEEKDGYTILKSKKDEKN